MAAVPLIRFFNYFSQNYDGRKRAALEVEKLVISLAKNEQEAGKANIFDLVGALAALAFNALNLEPHLLDQGAADEPPTLCGWVGPIEFLRSTTVRLLTGRACSPPGWESFELENRFG